MLYYIAPFMLHSRASASAHMTRYASLWFPSRGRVLANQMCKVSGGNHLSESQWWITKINIEKDCQGMHQHCAQQAAAQMPPV